MSEAVYTTYAMATDSLRKSKKRKKILLEKAGLALQTITHVLKLLAIMFLPDTRQLFGLFVAVGERSRMDGKDRSFFTYYRQNLRLLANSTLSVHAINFESLHVPHFKSKVTKEQLRCFPGAFPNTC